MKIIGLIGGVTWQSTAEYYRIINEQVAQKLGKPHCAKVLITSVDFAELKDLQNADDWEGIGKFLSNEAQKLERAGADFFLICANTLHKVAEEVQGSVSIPLLNVIDETAKCIQKKGLKTVGLLGTPFTMTDDFYERHLSKYRISTVTPWLPSRPEIGRVIYEELAFRQIRRESREHFQEIIEALRERGAEGIVLGCTEIPLLIQQEHSPIPVFDTTMIHATAAVERALRK